jgi:hypothetical protein
MRQSREEQLNDVTKAMLDEPTGVERKTPRDVEKLYSQLLQHMINRTRKPRCGRSWAKSGPENRAAHIQRNPSPHRGELQPQLISCR